MARPGAQLRSRPGGAGGGGVGDAAGFVADSRSNRVIGLNWEEVLRVPSSDAALPLALLDEVDYVGGESCPI
jgi:hypothetical protein